VHGRIDDDYPEITEALLNVLYPHYLCPVPPMCIVQFALDPAGGMTAGASIPRRKLLFARPVNDFQCRFSSTSQVELWPVEVASAEWTTPDQLGVPRPVDAVSAACIHLRCFPEVSLPALGIDRLRFYLHGEPTLMNALYELLCNNCTEIMIRDRNPGSRVPPVFLRGDALEAVGFDDDESALPYTRRSFAGYRLLQEYFAFPQKFLFVELTGLAPVWEQGFTNEIDIVLLVSRYERAERHRLLERAISADTFRMGCTPVVNLFPHVAEPIIIDHTRYEYDVVPDVNRRDALEVYSVDHVSGLNADGSEASYRPLYSYYHGAAESGHFWQVSRRPSNKKGDNGTDTSLTFTEIGGSHRVPEIQALTVRCTCTNRDLAPRLGFGNPKGDFEWDGSAMVERVIALTNVTEPARAPGRKEFLWRLVSHLSLNYLSLVSEGPQPLQELLKLYNFSDSLFTARQIAAISSVTGKPAFSRVYSDQGIAMVRGTRVEMELDEERFAGGGVYLFAAVLERFLGLYTSMNSFSQLMVRTTQRKLPLNEWQPRSGNLVLL
jgi:type VI secretion system protein ImpG